MTQTKAPALPLYSNNILQRVLLCLVIFSPLLLSFGTHSLTAYDEGYYSLQARWILQTHNWLAPQFFGHIVFDRTMGLQWLIALSYQVFGVSVFAARLPVLIAAISCLWLTHRIASLFCDELQAPPFFPLLATFILALTPLWLNYTHYAGQDIPLLAAELLCIYAIAKIDGSRHWLWPALIGPALGVAFFIKGFMVGVPIIAMAPYVLLFRRNLLARKSFWFGVVAGLIPIILWLGLCLKIYGIATVSELWDKLLWLSHDNGNVYSTHSIFYYFWNIPANTFPWALIAIPGWIALYKDKLPRRSFYFTLIYPLIILAILVIFKTKTPYYPIQLTPFISFAAAYFLCNVIVNGKRQASIFCQIMAAFATLLLIILCLFYIGYFTHLFSINNFSQIQVYAVIIMLLALPWMALYFIKSRLQCVLILLLGPWLALTFVVQSGLLDNRSATLSKALQKPALHNILGHNTINFITLKTTPLGSEQLLLLAFNAHKIGNRLGSMGELRPQSYAWVLNSKGNIFQPNITVMGHFPKTLGSWSLIYKK